MTDLTTLLAARLQPDRPGQHHLPAQRRLYEALKAAILEDRLTAGAVLPATRVLAADLGMARNTVLYAYEQLATEGYVQATRQGTVVRAVHARHEARASDDGLVLPGPKPALSKRVDDCLRRRDPQEEQWPFMPGVPALDAFPWSIWQRQAERVGRQVHARELGYRDASGEPELRQAIATYLRASRGVRCQADQVTVTDGTQQSLELCAQLLADPGDTAWIEHPGYGGARRALLQAGLRLQPVTVDADGMAPPASWWRAHPPRLIYTTPSHQYPLGSVLSLERRLHLIEQARRHGAWILEDDYDSEFRHDGPPLAAMQGLVPQAPVVYLGTFSKSLFPALRVGFIVWPEGLMDRVQAVLGDLVRRGRVQTQRTLAAFIDEGHFTRHLRQMRRLYRTRQAALREALAQAWPLPASVLGGAGGMHLVLSLPERCVDVELARAARAQSMSPRPLSAYSTGGVAGFNGLVMGYANVPESSMRPLIQRLAQLDPVRHACA